MPTSTGLNRLFGPTTQARMAELRRQTIVAQSEVTGEPTAAGSFPVTVDVIRRERTAAGNPAAGLPGSFATTTIGNLTAHVRVKATWRDRETGHRVEIADAQRVVVVADVTAGGNGLINELLDTDKLRFDDPIKGETIWDIVETRVRKPDQLVVALVNYAREDF